jgi:hypothetical protein
VDTLTKICTTCHKERPLALFRSRGGKQKHLLKSRCNTCLYQEHKQWVENNADRVKEYREKDSWTLVKRCARRGITPEQLVSTFESQQGKCPICLDAIVITDSAIDHNHATDEFRGVLCKQCNRALGMFRDNPKIIARALTYLLKKGYYNG